VGSLKNQGAAIGSNSSQALLPTPILNPQFLILNPYSVMKLANPIHYPLTVLVAAVALVAGVRLARLPIALMLPVSAAMATAGATWRKSQESEPLNLGNSELEAELLMVRRQAKVLADKASELRQQLTLLLHDQTSLELLTIVQYACDRASELPAQIDRLSQRMQANDSLLSIADLQQQLASVELKLNGSTGLVKEQLAKVAESLQRNIQLAQAGQDSRQVQVASLSALILDALSVMQELQNKLRSADLADTQQTLELRSLSEELSLFQENVDFLVK